MFRGNRVVLWDFDGTLARRPGLWSSALVQALALVDPGAAVHPNELGPHLSSGFPWHTPEIRHRHESAESWWEALQPTLVSAYVAVGIERRTAELAGRTVPDEFYRVEAWELIDGAGEALRLTRDHGYLNAIVSNHGPGLPGLVAALGLDIDRVITSAEVGAEKPHRAIFEFALEATDAGSDVWMVGDNPVADIDGAHAVGIRALLADGAYSDSQGMTVLEAARAIVLGETGGAIDQE